MIYIFMFMFVRVLYPKNQLRFVVDVTLLRVVYGLRDAEGPRAQRSALSLRLLVREVKPGNNAFDDAKINAKLVGKLASALRATLIGLRHTTIGDSFILYFCISTVIYCT